MFISPIPFNLAIIFNIILQIVTILLDPFLDSLLVQLLVLLFTLGTPLCAANAEFGNVSF